jgi:hypothetical protein
VNGHNDHDDCHRRGHGHNSGHDFVAVRLQGICTSWRGEGHNKREYQSSRDIF